MKLLLILLFNACLYSTSIYAQELYAVFDSGLGTMINEKKVVIACSTCDDYPDNTIVYYEDLGAYWSAYDSIKINDYYPSHIINDFVISKDGNTIGMYLLDEEDPTLFGYNDALLVLRKTDSSWQKVFEENEINLARSQGDNTLQIDFSSDADLLIISEVNFPNEAWSTSNQIETRIYVFNEMQYELTQTFVEQKLTYQFLTVNLLKDNSTILVGIDAFASDVDSKQYYLYTNVNGQWVPSIEFGDNVGDNFRASRATSDNEVKSIYVSKSFDDNWPSESSPGHIKKYTKESTSNNWTENSIEPYYSYPNFKAEAISLSDNGKFLAIGFSNPNASSTELGDTTSYVDYIEVDQNGYRLIKRMSFFDGNTNLYTGNILKLSENGRWLMLNVENTKLHLYDMQNLVSSHHKLIEDQELIFPNPTNGLLNLSKIEFDEVEVLNSTGKLIKVYEHMFLDISDYPNGLYYFKFISKDKKFKVNKVIKY